MVGLRRRPGVSRAFHLFSCDVRTQIANMTEEIK
jgi:hypothetical protein